MHICYLKHTTVSSVPLIASQFPPEIITKYSFHLLELELQFQFC